MRSTAVELASAYVSILPSTSKLAPTVRGQLDRTMPREGQRAGSKLGGALTGAVKKVAKAGLVAAGVTAGAALVSGFKAAVDQQQAEKTLAGLYGSAGKATQMMQSLRRVASTSPIDYSAYTKGAQSLAYMGIEGSKATGILKNIGAAAITAGTGSEGMSRATDAMLKMVNAGKVQLDTLNQLSDAGVPIFSGLAAHFNTNIENVRKMVTAGKVGIDDVMSVVQKAEGKTFQQMVAAAQAASQSVGAQWGILKNNLQFVLGDMFRPGVDALGVWMQKLNVAIGTRAPTILASLKTTMRAAFQSAPVQSVVGSLTSLWTSVTSLVAPMRQVGAAMAPFARAAVAVAIGLIVAAFKTLAGVGRVVAAVLGGIGRFAQQHTTTFRVLAGIILGAVAAWKVYRLAVAATRAVQLGMTAATYGQAGATYATGAALRVYKALMLQARIQTIATTVAQRTAAVVSRIWSVATYALGAAFRFALGPVGLIITAIGLLVAGVIYAWKNFGWFRTAVLATWNGIKTAALFAWNGVLKPVFAATKIAVLAVGQFFGWLWHTAVQPAWNGIKVAIQVAWIIIKAIFTAIKWYVWNIVLLPMRILWKVVKVVWAGIKVAIQVAWVLIRVIFGLIQINVKILGAIFRWLWQKVIRPVWSGIKRVIAVQWAAIKIVFTAIARVVRAVLGAVFRWLWHNVIQPVWAGIRRVIAVYWAAIRAVFAAIRRYILGPLATVFRWLWHSVISPVWNGIKRTISTVWNSGIKPVFTALWNFVRHSIPNAFRKGVAAVGAAWNKVKQIAKTPVSFVLRTVIGKGIVGGFNKIAGVFGVKKIDYKVPKGFRAGGAARGPGGKTGDKIPAWLSNDEHVWTAREVAGAGGHSAVERMRAAAARGMRMPFARGGRSSLVAFGKWLRSKGARVGEGPPPFGPVHRVHAGNSWHYRQGAIDVNYGGGGTSATEQAFFDKIIKSGIARKSYGLRSIWRYPGHYNHAHFDIAPGADLGMAQSGKRGLLAGLASAVGAIANPFKGLLGKVKKKMGDFGQWGGVLTASMKKLLSGAWDWVKDHNPFAGVGEIDGEVVTGGGKVRGIVRKTAKQFGWGSGRQWSALSWLISHESSWNPNAQNPTSTAYGLFQFLNGTWAGTGIRKTSNPAKQALAGMRYIKQRYNSPLGAQNFWRSHHWYDNGGMLQPGGIGGNKSRRPEPVLTNQQWRAVRAYLPSDAGGTGRAAGAQPLVGTIHVTETSSPHQVIDELMWRVRTMRRGGVYAAA